MSHFVWSSSCALEPMLSLYSAGISESGVMEMIALSVGAPLLDGWFLDTLQQCNLRTHCHSQSATLFHLRDCLLWIARSVEAIAINQPENHISASVLMPSFN